MCVCVWGGVNPMYIYISGLTRQGAPWPSENSRQRVGLTQAIYIYIYMLPELTRRAVASCQQARVRPVYVPHVYH